MVTFIKIKGKIYDTSFLKHIKKWRVKKFITNDIYGLVAVIEILN